MATLEAMLAAARDGDGRLVVVEGSAGIGKTRLLAETGELAEVGGFEVLTARGGELEGEFAFGIVRQLFEAPLAAATPELRAELLAGAAGLSASLFASAPTTASGEAVESSFAMLHGLYWLTANFASRTPTLLVVDDLHWADEPSLRWLHYLSRRLEGLPVLLLVGTRPPEQANLPVLVGELLADPGGVVMRPGGLGRSRLPRSRANDSATSPRPRSRPPSKLARVATRSTWSRCSTQSGGKVSRRPQSTRRTFSSWVREQSRTGSRPASDASGRGDRPTARRRDPR